jgi:chromosome segregation ATPase
MADTSDARMMERLERVETKIDRLETRFDHLETRFDHLETRFDGLEIRFGVLETRFDGLEIRFGVLETRFDRLEIRFGVLETRFEGLEAKVDGNARRNDIQIEYVRDDIRKLGESFGGVLERIERRLAESQTEMNTRLADHELVLRDHGRRITVLEPPPS